MNNANPRKSWAALLDLVLSWPPIKKADSPSTRKSEKLSAEITKPIKLTRLNHGTSLRVKAQTWEEGL